MKNWLKSRLSLNRKKVDLTPSANTISDQPKTFFEAIKPFLIRSYEYTVTVNEKLIANGPIPVLQTTAA